MSLDHLSQLSASWFEWTWRTSLFATVLNSLVLGTLFLVRKWLTPADAVGLVATSGFANVERMQTNFGKLKILKELTGADGSKTRSTTTSHNEKAIRGLQRR